MNNPKSQNKIHQALNSKVVGITETEIDPILYTVIFSTALCALNHL